MTVWMVFVLALGLSMDAFAVSISNAMCYRGFGRKQALAASVSFGVFQGIMPILGFFAGRLLESLITAVDHWIALVLLGIIGGKMVVEGIRALRSTDACPAEMPPFGAKTLLVQSVATSIDALAVGISFAALAVNIWSAAALIAVTTLVCCLIGSVLGRRFGALLGDWAQIVGGLLLVGIGVKIFVEHIFGL